jgi:hypothetical protein
MKYKPNGGWYTKWSFQRGGLHENVQSYVLRLAWMSEAAVCKKNQGVEQQVLLQQGEDRITLTGLPLSFQ